jgi:6-phosphogluconolactonase
LRLEVFPDAHGAARAAAAFLARTARETVLRRGQCVLACSGGSAPWEMYRLLALEPVPWQGVHIAQVDERLVPLAHDARNWKQLQKNLIDRVPLPAAQLHPMPVEEEDSSAGARRYAKELAAIAGDPARIDVVHLGLGSDGHTASLLPGDPVLDALELDAAITQVYQGHRRMTLTYPALNRARCRLWLVTGASKARALAKLLNRDPSVPAGRVSQASAVAFIDSAAAGQ